jgi:hypothetical protein
MDQKTPGNAQLVLTKKFYDELRNVSSQRNYGHLSFSIVNSAPQSSMDLYVAEEGVVDRLLWSLSR